MLEIMDDIQVIPVKSRKEQKAFCLLPWKIYRHDPHWVPPLLLERKLLLSRRHPYFKHAEAAFFLALRQGEPVGRISVQIDRLFLARYGLKGHWGLLEAVEDLRVFKALFETVETWLKDRGIRSLLGPFNLSINQECGLLVKGFDSPPSFLMGHAPPYYSEMLEALGHEKARDLLAYLMQRDSKTLARVKSLIPRSSTTVKTRAIDKKNLSQELDRIFAIFNEAWSKNWGFVPFTRAEYLYLGTLLRYLVPAELVRLAEIEDQPVAFIAVLPNFNEILAPLQGRLFPTGWAKLLWKLKFSPPRSARVVLMGIKRKYQLSMQGPLLIIKLIDDIRRVLLDMGVQALEISWILEDNLRMKRLAEALAGKPYKIYRIYTKEL